MTVTREGRVIGYLRVQAKTTEPAIEVHLLTQPPLGADAHAIADNQHPDHQIGINRGSAHGAVERLQLRAHNVEINEPIDAPKQVITGHMIIQAEIIEEPRRRCLPSHHRLSLRSLRATESAHGALLKREFFNRIGIRRTIGTAQKQKSPATAEIVGAMLSHCPKTTAGKRDRALLALGFAGAFRRSE